MAIANDTFVEASDTSLVSHTPTGTDAGAGWAALTSAAATVRAATDDVIDNNGSEGNRFRMTTDLGSAVMDVQADITRTAASFVFPGVLFRISSDFVTFCEFTYDDTRWYIYDGTNEVFLTESWPGGTVTMLAQSRTGSQKGYANGTLKVTISADQLNGNHYGGLILGNFSGGAGKSTADNYLSNSVAPGNPWAAYAQQ